MILSVAVNVGLVFVLLLLGELLSNVKNYFLFGDAPTGLLKFLFFVFALASLYFQYRHPSWVGKVMIPILFLLYIYLDHQVAKIAPIIDFNDSMYLVRDTEIEILQSKLSGMTSIDYYPLLLCIGHIALVAYRMGRGKREELHQSI